MGMQNTNILIVGLCTAEGTGIGDGFPPYGCCCVNWVGAKIIGAFIALLVGSFVLTALDAWKISSETKETLIGAPWHGEDMILSVINEVKTDGSPMQKLGAEMAETEVYLIDALDS